jgi:general secretion pathway protein K
VLWIVGLLALMAAGIGSSGRVSSHLAFNAVESTKARLLADAGVNRAIYHLLLGHVEQLPYIDGSLNLSFKFRNEPVAVQVRDEDGKIDVNAASAEVLAGLMQAAGLEAGSAAPSMAARIVDYRDRDSDASPSGAEDPAYEAANLAWGSADRPIRHLEELRRVLGMTDALFEKIRPDLTIYTDVDGLDPLRASRSALAALPGMTPEALAAIQGNNDPSADLLLTLPFEVVGPFEDYVLPSRDLVFEIRSLGQTEGGGRFLRETIIALDGGRGALPFSTYIWRRGSLNDGDPLFRMANALATSP